MTQATKAIKLQLEEQEESQFRSLDGQSKICNWLYNYLLQIANDLKTDAMKTQNFDQAKVIYTEHGLRNTLPSLKLEFPFLKSLYSSVSKNAALRVSSAILEYQKGKKGKRKNKVGWPRFRAWNRSWFSLFYDEPNKGYKVNGDILRLSLGVDKNKKRLTLSFRLKDVSRLKGFELRNLRITKENGKYYAIFTVQLSVPEKKATKNIIALDPNHKNFCYGTDNEGKAVEIEAPYWLKSHDKKLDELKSRRDRCEKKQTKCVAVDQDGVPTGKEYWMPSRQWQKRQKTYERELHKSREQKKTFMHTVAHYLCRNYDLIAIGDYAPRGDGQSIKMRRAMNNRSLIGQFKEILFWTATKSGKTVIEYDEQGTTRTCHACGYEVPGGLCPSIRKWSCPCCQVEHIRDENAAINGYRKILRDLKEKEELQSFSVPRSGLVSIEKRSVWRVLPSGVKTLSRGQNSEYFATPENENEGVILSTKS